MPRETFSTLRRACRVSTELTKAVATMYFSSRHRKDILKRAIVVRKTIERLGSIYIKFAQLIALRPDVIPKEYCNEMMHLFDRAPPIPIHEVKRIFREESGFAVHEVFNEFDVKPLGSASISQVHRGVLKDGTEVAVKVLRPNLESLQKRDLRILKALAILYDVMTRWRLRVATMVREVERWSEEEMDFRNEARSVAIFLRYIHNDPHAINAPKVYPDFSSRRCITMEYVEGFSLSRYIQATREGDKEFLSMAKQCEFNAKDAVLKVFRECAKYMFLKGIYHADLHPGNVIFSPSDKKLYYLDFGIVGVLDPKMGLDCMRYMRSAMYHEYEDAFEALGHLLDFSTVKKLNVLKRKHQEILIDIFEENGGGISVDKSQMFGIWIARTITLLYRYKLQIPLPLLKYFRALSVIESTIFEVYPEMKVEELARKVRNISIVHFLNNFSGMVEDGTMDSLMLKGLNVIEEHMYK